MSTSGAFEEWDVIVPADGEELLAELRRHGVRPGHTLHLVAQVVEAETADGDVDLPDYFDSFDSGQPDLAERSADILRAEFPGR